MISEKQMPVDRACFISQISKSGYYKWKNKPELADNNIELRKEIQGIALEFPFYGYRRITNSIKS